MLNVTIVYLDGKTVEFYLIDGIFYRLINIKFKYKPISYSIYEMQGMNKFIY